MNKCLVVRLFVKYVGNFMDIHNKPQNLTIYIVLVRALTFQRIDCSGVVPLFVLNVFGVSAGVPSVS